MLDENDGVLGLPMIVNQKTVDPGDKSTPEVFQLETAMGAAVGVFEGARTLVVPRTRFAPVKTTSDLLVLRSDAYVLTDDCRVEPSPDLGDGLPLVELDSDHFKLLRDFDARFPAGPPSLVAARRLGGRGRRQVRPPTWSCAARPRCATTATSSSSSTTARCWRARPSAARTC